MKNTTRTEQKPCRNGQDKSQMATEIITGELPPTQDVHQTITD